MIIEPYTSAEQIMYATVPIEVTRADGKRGSGTGFIYLFMTKDRKGVLDVLVTNKHVIKDAIRGKIRVHLADSSDVEKPSGETHSCVFDNFANLWYPHASMDVDIAVMDGRFLRGMIMKETGRQMFKRYIGSDMLPSREQLTDLNVVEDIIMAGYPIGLYDDVNNFPIFRSGNTATHPGVDFKGKQEFVIDMACFPGSSGSPVLVANERDYISRVRQARISGGRFLFLGILHSGPLITINGDIEEASIPTSLAAIARSKVMIHLGFVTRSYEVEAAARSLYAILAAKDPVLHAAIDPGQLYP